VQEYDDTCKYEFFRWSVIQDVVDLFMLEGRDKIMADVAEEVVRRLSKGEHPQGDFVE
jgi:hypothetical protein